SVAATLDRGALRRLRANRQVVLSADALVRAPDDASAQVQRSPALGLDTTNNLAPSSAATSPALLGHETGTDGYLLYPSAATGATLVQQMQVPTRLAQCAPQGVTVSNTTASRPLQGWGVTVAVIDSGFMQMQSQNVWRPI